jgi:hypothetical protein
MRQEPKRTKGTQITRIEFQALKDAETKKQETQNKQHFTVQPKH